VVSAGQAIVTVVDFSDTWAFAAIPETDADHIGLGDTFARAAARAERWFRESLL